MSRLADKLGSIRALCMLLMVSALCVACFVLQGEPAWPRLFESALMFLLGNYAGRGSQNQNPTTGGKPS